MPLMSARPCAMKVALLGHSDRERIQGHGMADFAINSSCNWKNVMPGVKKCCHVSIKVFGIDMCDIP